MSTTSGIARIICLLATCVLLGACSAVKLVYNNADEAAYWWLDSYADFSDAQAPRVREDLQRLHQWHRANELPRYVELLRKLEALVPGDVTAAQACAVFADIRARLDALADQAEPAVVTTAMGMEAAQIAHLERKYRRNNADYRKDWLELSPAQVLDKRLDQLVERSEMVYGRLDAQQRATLRRELARSAFDVKRNLAERERRQQDALQVLRKLAGQNPGFAEARTLLRGYLERVKESPDATYRAYQQTLIDEGCRSFAATHNSTNAAQRDAAVRRLRAYQRDLQELSAQR